MQTVVWSWWAPVFAQAGTRHSGAAKSAACRATAEPVNSVTDYRTTAEAVSSEVRRQLDRQRAGLAVLAGEGIAKKVSEQEPNRLPARRQRDVQLGSPADRSASRRTQPMPSLNHIPETGEWWRTTAEPSVIHRHQKTLKAIAGGGAVLINGRSS